MSYKDKIYDLDMQLKIKLNQLDKTGESRHDAKLKGEAAEYIFSYGTKRACYNAVTQLIKYSRDIGYQTNRLKDLAIIAPDFLKSMQDSNKSADSISSYASSIRKICGDFEYESPKRKRSNIKRGRDVSKLQYDWNAHKDLQDFCESCGLRRHEIKQVNKYHLLEKNGKYVLINIKGKGGRIRSVHMNNPSQATIELIKKSENSVLDHMQLVKRAPIHYFRRNYATQLYCHLREQRTESIDPYKCKDDLKGVIYDRNILALVSLNLGHGKINGDKRCNTIVRHYLDPKVCNEATYQKNTQS